MDTNLEFGKGNKPINILVVGNNPIDLSAIVSKFSQINGVRFITEIAFDMKSIVERLMNFKPNYIFIDDNIGKHQLIETVDTLSRSNKTKNIPITVLKNSNYQEAYTGKSFLDYVLKANLSTEALYNTVKNSLKFRKTQLFLYNSYKKKGGLLKRVMA
jgi:CheY-like chemotaxis protein